MLIHGGRLLRSRTLTPLQASAAAAGDPTDVAGLWSWVKADAGTFQDDGLTTAANTDADPLGGWQDQSGNSRHWVQATSGERPTFKTGILNSLPVIRGAAGDYLDGPDMSALTAGEVFIVIKSPGDAGDNHVWGTDQHYGFTDNLLYEDWGTDTRRETGNPTLGLDSFRLYNVASQSGEYTLRLDGTQHYTTATNTVSHQASPALFKSTLSGDTFRGDIAEMIIYSSVLSAGDRDIVEEYVANKYALTIA